jgi:hypothetical protein
MVDVVFDTDILIDHLRGVEQARSLILKVQSGAISGYISTLTEAELFAGKDEEDEKKRVMMHALLDLFDKIDITSTIARKAGEFRRKYGIEIDDALIGATAFSLNCIVYTRNAKDFGLVKDIESENPY